MFKGRKLVVATMHKKEEVIAPIIENELGVNCFVPSNFDTDILGTFSGETPRKLTQLETVRQKCLWAMELSKCDLGIASEGSFGPHPTLFFVPSDDEFLIFIDKKNDVEIISRKLSTETNFNGQEIHSIEELQEFAEKIKFPSHGIILKSEEKELDSIKKDFKNWKELEIAYQSINKNGRAFAETDMRAMNNPTRMVIIEQATQELIKKINSICPDCSHPGFSVTEVLPGLPCELCGMPTQSTLKHILSCKNCDYQEERHCPKGKNYEEPMYCSFCNP